MGCEDLDIQITRRDDCQVYYVPESEFLHCYTTWAKIARDGHQLIVHDDDDPEKQLLVFGCGPLRIDIDPPVEEPEPLPVERADLERRDLDDAWLR